MRDAYAINHDQRYNSHIMLYFVYRVTMEVHMNDNATATNNVTIYSADWCAFCHAAKDYLTGKGIAYEIKDVEKDPAYAQESVSKSGQMGIPVLDINGQIIVGFDRPRIDAALNL